MDSCDGYGRSRKHGAFPASMVQLSVESDDRTLICCAYRFMQRKHRVMLLLFCPLRCIEE